jgi:hypothetical protein
VSKENIYHPEIIKSKLDMAKKLNRNDACHCGSGKKYKNCCMDKDGNKSSSKLGMVGLALIILLGLVYLVMFLSGDFSTPDCPDGLVWSEAHQHCH